MRASSGREATCFLFAAAALLSLGTEGFLGPLSIPPAVTDQQGTASTSRCRAPRLSAMPPRKSGGGGGSAAAGGEENGVGDASKRMSRAPLRITPNFQPQEERRRNSSADQDNTYGAFLTEESFDIAAMAWAEFSDWLRRTIGRNVDGVPFEFDIRQWTSSIRKWSTRAVEMDVQAKADLFRLYERGIAERDAWGSQAEKVDDRVEDEWDNIYVDCSDCFESDSRSDSSSGRGGSSGSGSGSSSGVLESRGTFGIAGGGGGDAAAAAGEGAVRSPPYSAMRREGPWSTTPSELSAFDVYMTEEEEDEEDAEAAEDSEEEDIIDCAIRGRWTFENNDDPPHFSPQ